MCVCNRAVFTERAVLLFNGGVLGIKYDQLRFNAMKIKILLGQNAADILAFDQIIKSDLFYFITLEHCLQLSCGQKC